MKWTQWRKESWDKRKRNKVCGAGFDRKIFGLKLNMERKNRLE